MRSLWKELVFGKGAAMMAVRLGGIFGIGALLASVAGCYLLSMPGVSAKDAVPPDAEENEKLAKELKADIESICALGPRNLMSYDAMKKGAELIEAKFHEAGLKTQRIDFWVKPSILSQVRGAKKEETKKQLFTNIVAEVRGTERPEEIIVFGAHYDSAPMTGSVGADDNISGVAATLALAREFAKAPAKRTIRFIAFANEEPPFFWTDDMGSRVCAKQSAAARERIVAMITPECIGFYSDQPQSQKYPPPLDKLYPDTGNFIAFVGDTKSNALIKDCVRIFRESCQFPSEGASLPFAVPGVGWSDHWSYAKEGYPALMVTDTAPFRNPHYHTAGDTPDKLDYCKMAIVVDGLKKLVRELGDRT